MGDSNRSSQAEALLIEQILEGRRDLFYDLVRPHLPILLRFAEVRMRGDPECEDVVQQTILKAFTRLWQFRFEASFSTWLMRIAINEIHHWRRERKLLLFFVDHAALSELPVTDPTSSPFTEYERTDIRNLISEAIHKLGEKYQQVIRLRDLADPKPF